MYLQVIGPNCSGKTSLATVLARASSRASVYFEPVSESRIFKKFIQDKQSYAFLNQVDFMHLTFQIEQQIAADPATLIIQDCGLVVCHFVYNAYFRNQHYLNDHEYRYLEQKFASWYSACRKPDLVMYLTASPNILKERLLVRDFSILHNTLEITPHWLSLSQTLRSAGIPLVVLNTHKLDLKDVSHGILRFIE